MPKPISDFSPQAVIAAIEGNLVDASAALGRTEEGVIFRGTDVTWVYTGFPAFSRVLDARFPIEEADDRIVEILGYFKEWDATVSWVVGPSSYPPALGEYLHARGFGAAETWTGMAMELSALPKIARPPGLEIRPIVKDDELLAWAKLGTDLTTNGDAEVAVNIFSSGNAGSDTHCQYYLGSIDNKPIARAMAFRRDQVVGLYWITTVPEYRGQGISAAMAHHALQGAATAGGKVAVMSTSARNQSFCSQLGFKPYCQFSIYVWPATQIRMSHC